MRRSHFLEAALRREHFGLRIIRTQAWLATDARLAATSASRRAGLLGVDQVPDGFALVIAPTQGIHTFGMRCPLDIVGVDRNGTVLTTRSSVPRRRLVLSFRAFAMVELPAGTAARAGVQRGDVLEVVE